MSEELLPEWMLKKIYFSTKDIHKVAENISHVSDVANVLIQCIYQTEDFKGLKSCIRNSLDDLRHTREVYGGYPEEKHQKEE